MKWFTFIWIFILSLALLGCSSFEQRDLLTQRDPAAVIDLSKLSEISWSELPASQQTQLKNVFKNATKYLLYAAKKPESEQKEILKQAKTYLSKSLPRVFENIESSKTAEVTKLKSIPLAPQWTLKEEVRFLNNSSETWPETSLRPYLQQALDTMTQTGDLWGELVSTGDKELDEQLKNTLKAMAQESNSEKRELLALELVEKKVDESIEKVKTAAQSLADSPQIKFDQPFWEKLIREFIRDYFNESSDETMKNILSDILSLDHTPDEQEMARIMFRNSGPGLGKTLQQIGREAKMGKELAQLMAQLESEGKEVPPHLALESIEQASGGYEFTWIDPKPIGTGTVAQVHKARLFHEGKEIDVAVRFLKPGVKQRAEADLDMLRKIFERVENEPEVRGPEVPNLERVHQTLRDFLNADLNIENTVEKHKFAQEVYQRSFRLKSSSEGPSYIDFKVPEIYEDPSRKKPELIVTEFIEGGEKFSKVSSTDAKEFVSSQTVRIWAEEALFRSGHTHADLHEGNFKVFFHQGDERIKVVFFDFGMNVQVSNPTKRAFILIGAGAAYEDPQLISKALHALGEPPERFKNLNALRSVVQNIMQTEGQKTQAQWVTWAIQNGFTVPDDLGVLVRGGALINQMPVIVGQEGIEVKFVERFAVTYRLRNFFNRRYDFPLRLKDLTSVGLSRVKHTCRSLIQKIRSFD